MSEEEFGLFDEVNSEFITILVESLGNYDILGIEILEEHGIITNLLEKEWLSIQHWMNAFREIASRLGPSEIGKVGEKIAGRYSIQNKESMVHALELLQEKHDKFHQGKVGKYEIVGLGTNLVQITSNSPYSCNFDKSMILTIAKMVSKEANIKHIPSSCRDLGHKQCKYLIRW